MNTSPVLPSQRLFAIGRSGLFAFATLLVAPAASNAQPDAWMVVQSSVPAVRVDDLAGTPRRTFSTSFGVCLGEAVSGADRRSLFLPTSEGLARFDTDSRELVELVPNIVDCSDTVIADPSGRWWFALSPVGITSMSPRLRVVDAVARQIVAETHNSTLRAMTFDARGRRYELHEVTQSPSQFVVRHVTGDGAAPSTTWETALSSGASATHLGASAAGVFVAVVLPGGSRQVHRFNAQTGDGAGAIIPVDLSGPQATEMTVASIAATDTHVYLSGWFGATEKMALVSWDPVAQDIDIVTTSFPAGWAAGHMTIAAGAPVGYRTRNSVVLIPGPPVGTGGRVAFNVAIDTIDLASLETLATWTPIFLEAGVRPQAVLGQIAAPATPRVTRLATAGRRVELSWEPDAAGAPPGSFVVRGGLRGQSASTVLATLDANARTWQSDVVSPGEYVLEVVATNAVGESTPARLDVGIETRGLALAPADLNTFTAGRTVAKLTWHAPTSGPWPTGYLVEAAPQGGGFVPAAQTTQPELFVSAIPAGTWQVRVRGLTADGPGAASEPVVLQSATCIVTNDTPQALAALTNGPRVTLQWAPPPSGPPVHYRVEVASDVFGTNRVASLLVDGSKTSIEVTAPTGTYVVSVIAESPCTTSAPSNLIAARVHRRVPEGAETAAVHRGPEHSRN